jgi:hypothetical protein
VRLPTNKINNIRRGKVSREGESQKKKTIRKVLLLDLKTNMFIHNFNTCFEGILHKIGN